MASKSGKSNRKPSKDVAPTPGWKVPSTGTAAWAMQVPESKAPSVKNPKKK